MTHSHTVLRRKATFFVHTKGQHEAKCSGPLDSETIFLTSKKCYHKDNPTSFSHVSPVTLLFHVS